MAEEEPSLPLSPSPNRPPLAAFVGTAEIIGSGVATMRSSQTLRVLVANLVFDIVFVDDEEADQRVEVEQPSDTSLKVTLTNFNAPLGTTLNATQVGHVNEQPVRLALHVKGLGKDVRVVSYTFYWGGNLG